MKLRFFSQLAIATVVCMLFSFNTRQAAASTTSILRDNTHYYWYSADDDTYDSYNTISAEIVRMQGVYGVVVNTNSFGGTNVVKGFSNNIYPHQIWPSSFLYAHF